MTQQEEQQKRDALGNILFKLASSQDILKEESDKEALYKRLEDIYHDEDSKYHFRHFYSDIFSWLTTIDGDASIGEINTLAQNMEIIKEGYHGGVNRDKNGNPIDISKEIIKLYDHINLDVGRLNYIKRNSDKTQSQLAKVDNLISELQLKVEVVNKEAENIKKDFKKDLKAESERQSRENKESQKKMQNEYITILGIFAAIVLAFTGGMTFSSSVLENIHKSSIYRIIGISLVLGFILYNIMWLLIDFIRSINGQTIRKWWMSLLFNGIFVVMVGLTVFSYKFDWLSKKEEINKSAYEVIVEEGILEYYDL